jgi:hypothetical protein
MTRTLAFILSAGLAACAGQAEVRYAGNISTPEYVTLDTDPSVMVVANADEPVFYSENMYWLYRGEHWYRSSSHRSGWSRVDTPPDHVRRIQRPYAYVHVRPSAARTTYNQREQRLDDRAVNPGVRPGDREPARALDSEPNDGRPPVSVPDRRAAPVEQPSVNRPEPTPDQPPSPPSSATPRVPAPTPSSQDRPTHQVAPDPDRAPISPGQPARADDQRPAADRDDRRNDLRDPSPDQPSPRPVP